MTRAFSAALIVTILGCACASAQSGPLPDLAPPEDSDRGALQSDRQQNKAASGESSSAKARQLLDQMVAAVGGQAWLTYKTLSQQGRSYNFYHGKPTSEGILFWRFYEYPDKERRELTKQRDVVYIFNGGKSYERTYKGTAAEEEKVVEEILRRYGHSLEVVVREWLKDPKTMYFYDGQSVADQQLVDVVTLLNKENDQVSIGIDAHTHLPISKRYSWRDPDKYKVEEETIYGNYRKVQGIQTPFTITTTRDGEMTGQSFLSHAEYNAVFLPGFFEANVTYNPQPSRTQKK